MKLKMLSLIVLISISATFALAGHSHSKSTSAMSQDELQNNQETLGWLMVLNENEIASAKLVLKSTDDKAVKKFAEWMVRDHRKLLADTDAVLTATHMKVSTTEKVKDLKIAGKTELDNLAPLKGSELNHVYMNAMVNDHSEGLSLIDTYFSKEATNVQVKKLLTETRMHVAHHLKEAKLVQSKLK